MKIRPLHDRVIVRREEEEQTTAGGILLPGSAQEKPNQGEVVAVGSVQRNGIVAVVDLSKVELLKVADEPGPDLARRHIQRGVVVEF